LEDAHMSALTYAPGRASATMAGAARPVEEIGFDRLMAAASAWLVGGTWLDAWAHHNVPSTLETFFTPWHAVLYAGLLATLGVLATALVRNHMVGHPWRRALPRGYELSLVGGLVFAAGGLADMAWHLMFGIEVGLEALLSPSHLLLALGGVLIVSGPLRAAWPRPISAAGGWGALLPGLLSLAFVLSLLTFFTEYANPFSTPWPAGRGAIAAIASPDGAPELSPTPATEMLGQVVGVASILLSAALLMGVVLLAVRRWALPFGALALLFTLNYGLSVAPHGQYRFIPVALLGGLVADLLLARLRPSAERRAALRVFAFAVPASLFGLYFLALALTGGIAWTVHLWAGAIALAGVVGLLLSYLVAPPFAAQPPA
jgi:hypothetical protein